MPRRRFDPLDISQQVNRELMPNPAGSPSSHGTDFCWLATGTHPYEVPGIGKVPFHIIDQNENGGRAVAITHGGLIKQQTSMQFPRRFEFAVPEMIRSRVVRVHFLGVAAFWAMFTAEAEGTHGADIVLTYVDGTQMVVPLINGLHYSDWAFEGVTTPKPNGDGTQVVTVARGPSSNHEFITRADVLTIDLVAHAHRLLRKIAIVDSGSAAAIPVVAVTLERETTVTTDADEPTPGALHDLMPVVRLSDQKRLAALLDALIQDIEADAHANLSLAKSRAIQIVNLLAFAVSETGASSESLSLLPLRSGVIIARTRDAQSLLAAVRTQTELCVNQLYPKRNLHVERAIEQAMEFIRRHYAEDVRDREIASNLSISTSHFRHLFRTMTGVSFGKYVTLVRMENARRLLEDTHLAIGEIARKIGYDDVSYFSRVFCNHFWVSPSEYRKKSG